MTVYEIVLMQSYAYEMDEAASEEEAIEGAMAAWAAEVAQWEPDVVSVIAKDETP